MNPGRCGFTYETERYPDLGGGCCRRPAWDGDDRCIWHAVADGKPREDLESRAHPADVRLDGATLRSTSLDGVDWFSNAVLTEADFEDSTAERVDFSGADLRNANFRNASLRESGFRAAVLEDAVLRDADLTGTDLRDARLHEADFSLAYIGRGTTFGDSVVYERELFAMEDSAAQQERFDAAVQTYRALQFQFRQNALLERTKEFFVREKDLRRRFAWQQGNVLQGIRAEASRWLMGYGFSISGILGTSLAVILLCALLYPFLGGVKDTSGSATDVYALSSVAGPSLAELLSVFSRSLYFSVISFTTLGAGDVLPNGFVVRILSGLEALLGFVLLALLISVLARRQYWL